MTEIVFFVEYFVEYNYCIDIDVFLKNLLADALSMLLPPHWVYMFSGVMFFLICITIDY